MTGNLKKNLGLQTIYQVLNTCLPLITAPYLARTLGAKQLGIFSYTSSIVTYFILFAMLGTVNYGTRSIAIVKDDTKKRSKVFCEIYILQRMPIIQSVLPKSLQASIAYKSTSPLASLQTLEL